MTVSVTGVLSIIHCVRRSNKTPFVLDTDFSLFLSSSFGSDTLSALDISSLVSDSFFFASVGVAPSFDNSSSSLVVTVDVPINGATPIPVRIGSSTHSSEYSSNEIGS